jgi:hypothetical protein
MAESYRTSAALGSLVAGLRDFAAIERTDAWSYEVVRDPDCEHARLRPSGDARRPAELLVLSLRGKMCLNIDNFSAGLRPEEPKGSPVHRFPLYSSMQW